MPQRPSEDVLIARFFAPLADPAAFGLRDDAACLTPKPGHDLVVTTDALVENLHFFSDDPPASIARKALGVNVSDLAAKGADPRGFVISLALPADWTQAWLQAFADGLGQAARDFTCPLLGGDTVKASGGLTLSVTAIGEVPAGTMVRRTTACAGDAICVSGTIGDAALGLILRREPDWAKVMPQIERDILADRYLHPQPRHALAAILRRHASAAMDISDGLAGDLAKMLSQSGVTGFIETNRIPLSRAARSAVRADPSLIEQVFTGGDDYEVLCTIPQDALESFIQNSEALGIPLTVIGQVLAGEGLPAFRDGSGERRFETGSFSHF